MSFKIAFIGAGSVGFTRRLFSDLMTVPEFRNIEVSFMDINAHNLDMVAKLCQRDIDAGGVPIITPAASEAAGYGAAMIAGCATGAFSGYDEAYNAFDIKEKHYKTDTAMHKEYRRFFENYKSVFQSMKKEFDNS